MNHNLEVSKSIIVNADVAKVWDALTNPEIIKEYLFGTETITDWKVGSDIIFQGEYNGQKYRDKGIVRENILHQRISYNYWSAFTGLEDKPENYSLVTYVVTPKGNNQTELTWIQKGFGNEDGYKHSLNGMDGFMKSMKAVIER
jgi:uncharacterized protein YndB with AHSA1/START domain